MEPGADFQTSLWGFSKLLWVEAAVGAGFVESDTRLQFPVGKRRLTPKYRG